MDISLTQAPFSYALMLLIPAVSLFGLFVDRTFVTTGLFDIGAVVRGKQYHRIVTAAFLHGDVGHLLVNMLTFFFFGPAVEAIYGTTGFIVIFFGSQIGAMMFTLLRKRKDPEYRSLGASGAVSGILFAFCVYAPMAQLSLLFAIPVPAFLFAIGYVAYSTFAMNGPGRISHEAHLGGAISGAILGFLLLA